MPLPRLSNKSSSNFITTPLFSVGTNNVLLTCKPPKSCLVLRTPLSCLEETTKFGSLLRTPSSIDISITILPKDRAGGTYKPPLSYITPIQDHLAEISPLDEHTIYAFLPDKIKGLVKFLKMVSSFDVIESGSSIIEGIKILSLRLLMKSLKVKGIIICSKPSSLLKMTILCLRCSSKPPSFIIRNLAL